MNNGWTGGQYSIFRVILGICVCTWSVGTVLPLQGATEQGSGEWWGLTSFLAVVPVLSVLLIVGWHERIAALVIALCILFALKPPLASSVVPLIPLLWLLLLQVALPAAPYGSLAARGRLDPGNGWAMRPVVYAMGWLWLAALQIVIPLVQHEPIPLASIVLALLALEPRVRPWSWTGLFGLFLWRAAFGQHTDEVLLLSLLLYQLFTFDPAWVLPLSPLSPGGRGAGGEGEGSQTEPIFYDGHCGLCHRAVRFVLAEDRDGKTFRFAPLDSDAFRAAVPEEERKNLPDSIVVRTTDGRTLVQAQAILYIMQRLGGLWRIIATLAKVIPPALLDVAYAGIARIRHRLFAKPADACPILPRNLRGRFDF